MRRTIISIFLINASGLASGQPPVGTLAIDNDLFASRGHDRDYTAGIRYTSEETNSATWQAGLLLFTPGDITSPGPLEHDRPYSNLLYLARSKTWSTSPSTLYRHTWSVGLLGSGIAESIQRSVHEATSSTPPRGYKNQISDGGELTGRLGISHYRKLFDSTLRFAHLTVIAESSASIGYMADASYALGFRLSRSGYYPWAHGRNDFLPQLDAPEPANGFEGLFGGFRVRARAYNALLQGQFRDSQVTVSSNELRRIIPEAWLGVSNVVHGWQIRYTVRYTGAETERGLAAGSHTWGGVVIKRSF